MQGKGKSRKLVAPKSVGDYLNRVRELSKATKPDDPVSTIINGKPAKYLYADTVQDMLVEAGLRIGAERHSALDLLLPPHLRDVPPEQGRQCLHPCRTDGHLGQVDRKPLRHVNTIKHAGRVLMGMTGWELIREPGDDGIEGVFGRLA